MSDMILSTINPEDLIEKIARRTAEILRSEQPEEEEMLSQEEALAILKCSPATLWRNRTKGKIKGYWVGGKPYYSKLNIMQSFKQKIS